MIAISVCVVTLLPVLLLLLTLFGKMGVFTYSPFFCYHVVNPEEAKNKKSYTGISPRYGQKEHSSRLTMVGKEKKDKRMLPRFELQSSGHSGR